MLAIDQVIKELRFTEKSNQISSDLNQYTFEINPRANKIEVAYAVERLFSVTVTRVNIINQKGKLKRSRNRKGRPGCTSDIKKAIVTLKEGEKIQLI